MNEIQIRKMKDYEQNTNVRRNIFISLLVCMAIVLPLGFYIFTVNETLSFKNLDQERYESRMNDSFLYASVMFGCLLLLVSPFIFIINNKFQRYLEFIRTLTVNEAEKLFSLNERENFIYKYMPSYIIRGHTVTFFTLLHQKTINFNEIMSIDVRQVFHKGYRAVIVIKTLQHKHHYTLAGDSFKVRNLVTEALIVNPKIVNNENWNY